MYILPFFRSCILYPLSDDVYFTLSVITVSPVLSLISAVSISSALVFDRVAEKLSPV
jgi:hypothetical protein